ncbi:MAG: RdgB/HAM1 family non-canonical purine NTP pyrophosphatase [Myxococcota bacterium]|nr:RdgB/HAM1 family non-canonical purine NTP pyrophosphatase [Myxococcota bacterium]
MSRTLLLATRNSHKLREVKEILAATDFEVISIDDLSGIPEVIEDGDSFQANADKKARTLAQITGRTAIADDSGIEVDALGGEPGIYSARFAGVTGPGADDANNRLLVSRLQGVVAEQRTARYRCVLAVVTPSGDARYTEGSVEGRIADEAIGDGGFGYDPHFEVEGDPQGRRMAQLSPDEKNAISHRGKALRNLLPLLEELLGAGEE